MSIPNFQVGDTARKATMFLRNTGQYFDDGTHGWGKVIEVVQSGDRQIVSVQWGLNVQKVLNSNLEKKRQP